MPRRLEGKVAVVNGGGSLGTGWGNGRCTAVQLAREGAKLVVVDINREAAEFTAGLIRDEGGTALVIEADATSGTDLERMAAATIAEFGRLDILAHIIGCGARHELFDESEDEWNRVFRMNVTSAYLASLAVLPQMQKQRFGRIVALSSIASLRFLGGLGSPSYPASKAALTMLMRQLGAQFAGHGITCNSIAVGMIDGPHVRDFFGAEAEKYSAMRDRASPTGRQGTGWDTAHLIAFLASEEAGYLNSMEIPLDAGFTFKAPAAYPSS